MYGISEIVARRIRVNSWWVLVSSGASDRGDATSAACIVFVCVTV